MKLHLHQSLASICLITLLVPPPNAGAQSSSTPTSAVPAGMVAYYTQPTTGANLQCPTGWNQYQPGQYRLIMATTNPSEFLVTNNGTPISQDQQSPQHSHPFAASWDIDDHASKPGSGSTKPFASAGSNNTTGTSNTGNTGYGFIQYLVCESPSTSNSDQVPYGALAFFDTTVTNPTTNGGCPTNWSPVPQLDGFFLMPVAPNAQIGNTYNGPGWNINSFPTHQHPIATIGSFPLTVLGLDRGEGTSYVKTMANPVPVSVALGSNTTAVLPAIAMAICAKTGSGTGNGLPAGISLFYSQTSSCPGSNWGLAIGAPGRLIIGIGGNATTGVGSFTQGGTTGNSITTLGANPAHTHQVTVTADVGENTSSHDQGSETNYGKGGSYSVTGTSGSATIAIPYATFLLCQVMPSNSN